MCELGLDSNAADFPDELGKLSIWGRIYPVNHNAEVPVLFNIISTNLLAEEWCDEELIGTLEMRRRLRKEDVSRALAVSDLTLSPEFKLKNVRDIKDYYRLVLTRPYFDAAQSPPDDFIVDEKGECVLRLD
jgi:hypothetical protein